MVKERLIDLSTFNLVYMRKDDGRLFLVRLIAKPHYIIIDTQTGVIDREMTEAKLKRWYVPMRHLNKVNKKKPYFLNYGRERIA